MCEKQKGSCGDGGLTEELSMIQPPPYSLRLCVFMGGDMSLKLLHRCCVGCLTSSLQPPVTPDSVKKSEEEPVEEGTACSEGALE